MSCCNNSAERIKKLKNTLTTPLFKQYVNHNVFNKLISSIDFLEKNYGIVFKNELYQWDVIEKSYSNKVRSYHDLEHVNYMLELLSDINKTFCIPESRFFLNVLIYSIIYHDIVYDVKNKDFENVNLSAELAASMVVKDNNDFLYSVNRCILATNYSEFNDSTEYLELEKFIINLDLHQLASQEETFSENTKKIRAEFEHLTEQEFASGRISFFNKLLNKKSIFLTLKDLKI